MKSACCSIVFEEQRDSLKVFVLVAPILLAQAPPNPRRVRCLSHRSRQ